MRPATATSSSGHLEVRRNVDGDRSRSEHRYETRSAWDLFSKRQREIFRCKRSPKDSSSPEMPLSDG